MENDPYLEILVKKVEGMNKRDKTGMSLVEIMKPYQDLKMYVDLKIQLEIQKWTDGK